MTDDVMKKVESLLFDEDDPETEEIKEEEEKKEEKKEKIKEEEKEVKERKIKSDKETDCIEISFDGYAVVSGAKIKTLPGSEIEVNGLRLVFKDSKVMIFV